MNNYDLNDTSINNEEELAAFRWLRENDPVHWDEKNHFWLISRHSDVQSMLKQPQLFSSEPKGPWHMFDTQFSMQAQDGKKHDAVRQTVGLGFRPRSIRALEKSVLAYTDAAIDKVANKGECDLVESLAAPIPTAVIARLLGFDDDSDAIDLFQRWGDAVFGAADWGDEHTRVCNDFNDYIKQVVEQRKQQPGDDLLSEIVNADNFSQMDEQGQPIDILEPFYRDPIPGMPVGDGVMGFIAFLVLAGSETTRHAISHGMNLLLSHPEQLQKLQQDPQLIDGTVDEILRYTSIVRTMRRTVMADTEWHGKTLRAGDSVVFLFRSANMDDSVFTEPEKFLVDRQPNDHIAFGWGSHFCLGSNLAKLEIRVVIQRLLQRLPQLALKPGSQPVNNANPVVNGLAQLPIVFQSAA